MKTCHSPLFAQRCFLLQGFPGGSEVKNSSANAGDAGSTPGLGRSPGKGQGNPLQYSCLENTHGQRSLADYSPWGCIELDTTEWLSTHTQSRHGQTFSLKGQIVDILAFVNHVISAVTTQFCHLLWQKSSHRQYISKWMLRCCNKALFIKTKDRLELAHEPWFPDSWSRSSPILIWCPFQKLSALVLSLILTSTQLNTPVHLPRFPPSGVFSDTLSSKILWARKYFNSCNSSSMGTLVWEAGS